MGWNKIDRLKTEIFPYLLCNTQMSHMHRVEGSAKDAYSHSITHLSPQLTVAETDELCNGKLFEPHRPECVEPRRADPHLGAEAKLKTIVQPGRRVDQHKRGIYLAQELPCPVIIGRNDRLGVA